MLLLAGLCWSGSTWAACDLKFTGTDSKSYPQAELAKFVDEQIRPKLTKTQGSFKITIDAQCNPGGSQSIVLTFDDTDYYITYIQDHHLSQEEATYKTSPLNLSLANLGNEILKAKDVDNLPLADVQNLVKTLAFFFAETARFSEVENIATSIVTKGCTAEWLDYATLLRRWSKISRLALHENNKDWTARGGANDNLIAPVSGNAVSDYNAAIDAGQSGPNASFVDDRDWGKPISVPAAACNN